MAAGVELDLSATHRFWVVPILQTLEEMGGSSAPSTVIRAIRHRYREVLNGAQFANVLKNKHIQWTRLELRTAGLLDGEHGEWRITNDGRSYLEAHRNEEIDFSAVPELEGAENQSLDEVETVAITAASGYEIPVLELLQEGYREPREIVDVIAKRYATELLPGDLRTLPRGQSVHNVRINSAIAKLKSLGQARSTGRAQWTITEAGARRLKDERDRFTLRMFQNGEAKVRALLKGRAAAEGANPAQTRPPQWLTKWAALSTRFPEIHQQLHRRIRPDLGPTPSGPPIQRNAILYGPPGTGKTFVAKLAAQALTEKELPGSESSWRIVQFHPSYAYEDFVQGLRPNLQQTGARFELRPGPFVEICNEADEDPDRFYVLIIDEINRGDPARIFGELLYAIEYRDEPIDLAIGGQLTVPPNLVILGTMNSVDRSVALVDHALRRRFGFIRVDPTPELIEELRADHAAAPIAASVLQTMNTWLTEELDREHALGHSFFLNAALPLENASSLDVIWNESIHPLLEEYFHGDASRMNQATQTWRRAISKALEEAANEGS